MARPERYCWAASVRRERVATLVGAQGRTFVTIQQGVPRGLQGPLAGCTARTGASPVPTRRRLGRPARRLVGVPLAGTLARFPLPFASKVRRRRKRKET